MDRRHVLFPVATALVILAYHTSATAEEPRVQLRNRISYARYAKAPSRLRVECDLEAEVPRLLAESLPRLQMVPGEPDPSGLVLELEILFVVQMTSGRPAWLTLLGRLYQAGTLLGSFQADGKSRGWTSDRCKRFETIATWLGPQLEDFLRQPVVDARLGQQGPRRTFHWNSLAPRAVKEAGDEFAQSLGSPRDVDPTAFDKYVRFTDPVREFDFSAEEGIAAATRSLDQLGFGPVERYPEMRVVHTHSFPVALPEFCQCEPSRPALSGIGRAIVLVGAESLDAERSRLSVETQCEAYYPTLNQVVRCESVGEIELDFWQQLNRVVLVE